MAPVGFWIAAVASVRPPPSGPAARGRFMATASSAVEGDRAHPHAARSRL